MNLSRSPSGATLRLLALVVAVAATTAGCGGGGAAASPGAPAPAPTLAQAVDGAMTPFMQSRGITAATVAVVKDGQVLYEQGYGHRDAAGTQPLPRDALMLTASVVKPITAAMIQQLAAAGTLTLDDHVFCTGSNAPCRLSGLLPAGADARAADITVRELLSHQGGWDARASGDPMTMETAVQASLGLTGPPSQDDDIRWTMSRPLDFAPGTATAYSNFGYLLLGRIVEAATGTDFVSQARRSVLQPLGVPDADFAAAASLLANRDPREPAYITSITAPSVFVPRTTVSALDGAVNAPNWTAAATAITTARAMALFAGRYRIDTLYGPGGGPDQAGNGLPLAGTTHDGYKNGNLPGSATLVRQLPSGVSYAVFFDKSDDTGSGSYQDAAKSQMDLAIAAAMH